MSEQRYPSDVIDRAEALVSRVQGISSCRISTDEVAEITEVHVVATSHKPPKLVARDVEGCLKAMLGIHVDHRKIGVVVFDAVEDEEPCNEEARAIHDNPVPDGEPRKRHYTKRNKTPENDHGHCPVETWQARWFRKFGVEPTLVTGGKPGPRKKRKVKK